MHITTETEYGKVRGHRAEDGIVVFKGVPFARAERFGAPQPQAPWPGVRDALEHGSTPPQLPTPLASAFPPQGEDCLNAIVWTPACDDAQRPVMVWVHGGGFLAMAAADDGTAGATLALRGDVVVVAIEYRQGVLGFLPLGGDHATNAGLLDQVAGLEWVRDNIAAFGGDPGNVTLFGESAGGMSIGCLLAMPAAEGLFHKAVLQSGAGHAVVPRQRADRVAALFRDALGATDPMRATTEQLLAAQAETMAAYRPGRGEGEGLFLPFQPVLDAGTLPCHPTEALRAGSSSDVPVMVGFTNHEFRLFTELLNMPVNEDAAGLERQLDRIFGDAVDAPKVVETYVGNRADQEMRFVSAAVVSDVGFRLPAIRLAEARETGAAAPTYMYRFDYESTLLPDGRLGACHAVELPFLFDIDGSAVSLLAGMSRPRSLVESTQSAWLRFARSGEADWPVYDTLRRATYVFDVEPGTLDDPDADERRLWDALL